MMAAVVVSPWPKTMSRILPLYRSLQCRNCSQSILLLSHSTGRNFDVSLSIGDSRRNVSTLSTADHGQFKSRSKGSSNKEMFISKAMRVYLEKAREYDSMMKAEVADYEIGKRHLANIMGENPETFTQDDVNRAIEYLLPNGIFHKNARPMMKDPYQIFPKRKAAQFGFDGRPHDSMYFTTKPNYYNILYDINWKMEDLKVEEDQIDQKSADEQAAIETANNEFKTIDLARSEWISKDQLQEIVLENIHDKDFQHFCVLMDRLAGHPLSHTLQEFIMKYRNQIHLQSNKLQIPEIEIDSNGRSFARAEGVRKKCRAWVKVYKPGSGKVEINGQDLSFFKNNMYRQHLLDPLSVAGLLDQVDICAEVELNPAPKHVYNNFHAPRPEGYRKGPTAFAGAIRLGLSRCLTAFVDGKKRENLRLAGLLTPDPRTKERKKPGQEKARKKFTWKKR